MGELNLIILKLKSDEEQFYKLDTIRFEKILSFQFKSYADYTYECHIACKRVGIKQICVFNIVDDQKLQRGEEAEESLKILNFMNNPDADMKVQISKNLNSVVLVNGDENFIFYKKGNYFIQMKLVSIKNKIVRFILCD